MYQSSRGGANLIIDRCMFDSSLVCGSTNLDDCIGCDVGPGPRVPLRRDDYKAIERATRLCQCELRDASKSEVVDVLQTLLADRYRKECWRVTKPIIDVREKRVETMTRSCRNALHGLALFEALLVIDSLASELGAAAPERCEDIAASEEALIVETCIALGLPDGGKA